MTKDFWEWDSRRAGLPFIPQKVDFKGIHQKFTTKLPIG